MMVLEAFDDNLGRVTAKQLEAKFVTRQAWGPDKSPVKGRDIGHAVDERRRCTTNS